MKQSQGTGLIRNNEIMTGFDTVCQVRHEIFERYSECLFYKIFYTYWL